MAQVGIELHQTSTVMNEGHDGTNMSLQPATPRSKLIPKRLSKKPPRRHLPPPNMSMGGPDIQFCGQCNAPAVDEAQHAPLHVVEDTIDDEEAAQLAPLRLSSERQVVKSTFSVQGICCASEVPSIRKIVRPLRGVASLQINIFAKRLYVQHEPELIGAREIAQRLSNQGFPASIVHNGGSKRSSVATDFDIDSRRVGRTRLRTEKSLEEQDLIAISEQLQSLDGVEMAGLCNNKLELCVEHDVNRISAAQLYKFVSSKIGTDVILVQDAKALLVQTEQANAILSQPRSDFVESTIFISNLTASHCKLLAKAVAQNFIPAQVRVIHPHISSRTAKVEHNPTLMPVAEVCNVLGRLGMDCSVVTDGQVENLILPMLGNEDTEQANETKANSEMIRWRASRVSIPVLCSGIFWIVSLLSVVQGWERLEFPAGVLSVLFGLPPVAWKAWKTIRRCEYDANCMMVTAAIGALALGEWDEAASVAFLFSISEFLEARASDKARNALMTIVQLRPEHANLIHPETKEIVVVPADRVPVGSLISVRTGDTLPADGVVVEGTSQIDESSLTGESVPVQKKINETVSGGGINVGSTQLVVRTTTSVENSAVSRLIRLVEEAQANRSPTEKTIDGFARVYTPAVVFAALLLCTIPWLWGQEVGRQWTLNGLIIIVIACPCALAISTPVTYSAALAATAQRGIVVKGGATLETLGGVSTVLVDKTGTLTEGKFKLRHLQEIDGTRSRKQMLELLAIMEAPSGHPLSATLLPAIKHEIGAVSGKPVKQHTTLKGEGVTALVEEERVYVGNARLFDRIGLALPEKYSILAEQWSDSGGSVGFIGVEGEGIIGLFCVTDIVRPESKDVIEALLRDGVDVQMLTGDSEGAALSVAQQVGLSKDAVHAKLLPEDKLDFVQNSKSTVLFCGDGVNDAPALAAADVGVSMGEGASFAMEMSDMTLMDCNLHKLLYAKKMGSQVLKTIRENIFISLACKVVVVVLTFLGSMTLMYAVASDVGVMLLVTLNGMKLLPGSSEAMVLQPRGGYSEVLQDDDAEKIQADDIA